MSTDVPRKRAHGAARVRRVPGTSVSARDGGVGLHEHTCVVGTSDACSCREPRPTAGASDRRGDACA